MSFRHTARTISTHILSCSSRGVATKAGESSRQFRSIMYTDLSKAQDPSVCTTPEDITPELRSALDSALRVDQAGEVAANWIYRGQLAVLGKDSRVGPIIQEMWDQEKKHLEVMNKMQAQHRIRPTIFSEAVKVAGFALGAGTAILGKEAAMACTEAVETVIGEHYDDQLKAFAALPSSHPSVPLLLDVVREFRDDELEHLDIAVDHFSQRAPAHALLSTIVGGGCMAAIELCKRL